MGGGGDHDALRTSAGTRHARVKYLYTYNKNKSPKKNILNKKPKLLCKSLIKYMLHLARQTLLSRTSYMLRILKTEAWDYPAWSPSCRLSLAAPDSFVWPCAIRIYFGFLACGRLL